MTEPDLNRLNARSTILKALAHPTRLWLLEQLQQQDLSVLELTRGVNADISTVSKHLSVLKQVGIISNRREGKQVFYSLETPCLLNMFSCVETVLEKNALAHAALVKPSSETSSRE
ncbi:ArsR/SmtB family transcription factor [Shewanella donghaensis]|uniref:ArsR/SmtB family transcription factor n=1 Tax=Shewanella donghaensis TaxID=238836 RepID=UPI0011845A65|nr:metalloregulator ArsR/SmtB family transcription factor [Shewanella donghaensis]